MNSLPKTVTRQRRDCDLNPGPTAPEFSTLTTKIFFKRLDQFSSRQHQDFIFDFQAQIEGTGSRSEVSRVNIV